MSDSRHNGNSSYDAGVKAAGDLKATMTGFLHIVEGIKESTEKTTENAKSIATLVKTSEEHDESITKINGERMKTSDADKIFGKREDVEKAKTTLSILKKNADNFASKSSVSSNTESIELNSKNVKENAKSIEEVNEKIKTNSNKIEEFEKNYLKSEQAAQEYAKISTTDGQEERIKHLETTGLTKKEGNEKYATKALQESQKERINSIASTYLTIEDGKRKHSPLETSNAQGKKIKRLQDTCLSKSEANRDFVKREAHEETKKMLNS